MSDKIYLVIGGGRDLSQTSARKSHDKYLERINLTKEDFKFKFDLGIFSITNAMEDIAAGICIVITGFILLSFL